MDGCTHSGHWHASRNQTKSGRVEDFGIGIELFFRTSGYKGVKRDLADLKLRESILVEMKETWSRQIHERHGTRKSQSRKHFHYNISRNKYCDRQYAT